MGRKLTGSKGLGAVLGRAYDQIGDTRLTNAERFTQAEWSEIREAFDRIQARRHGAKKLQKAPPKRP